MWPYVAALGLTGLSSYLNNRQASEHSLGGGYQQQSSGPTVVSPNQLTPREWLPEGLAGKLTHYQKMAPKGMHALLRNTGYDEEFKPLPWTTSLTDALSSPSFLLSTIPTLAAGLGGSLTGKSIMPLLLALGQAGALGAHDIHARRSESQNSLVAALAALEGPLKDEASIRHSFLVHPQVASAGSGTYTTTPEDTRPNTFSAIASPLAQGMAGYYLQNERQKQYEQLREELKKPTRAGQGWGYQTR